MGICSSLPISLSLNLILFLNFQLVVFQWDRSRSNRPEVLNKNGFFEIAQFVGNTCAIARVTEAERPAISLKRYSSTGVFLCNL